MRSRASAVLATALALGAPAPVLAQSVGDEQYHDPFAGEVQAPDKSGENPAPAPSSPAPAPAPSTSSAPAEPTATTAGTLPRTGQEDAWIAAAGLLLIAAGAGLRRTART